MLIHSGVFHATFNILVQLVLGIPLEMVHGELREKLGASQVIGISLYALQADTYTVFSTLHTWAKDTKRVYINMRNLLNL